MNDYWALNDKALSQDIWIGLWMVIYQVVHFIKKPRDVKTIFLNENFILKAWAHARLIIFYLCSK